jgi:hypothetical protein
MTPVAEHLSRMFQLNERRWLIPTFTKSTCKAFRVSCVQSFAGCCLLSHFLDLEAFVEPCLSGRSFLRVACYILSLLLLYPLVSLLIMQSLCEMDSY